MNGWMDDKHLSFEVMLSVINQSNCVTFHRSTTRSICSSACRNRIFASTLSTSDTQTHSFNWGEPTRDTLVQHDCGENGTRRTNHIKIRCLHVTRQAHKSCRLKRSIQRLERTSFPGAFQKGSWNHFQANSPLRKPTRALEESHHG